MDGLFNRAFVDLSLNKFRPRVAFARSVFCHQRGEHFGRVSVLEAEGDLSVDNASEGLLLLASPGHPEANQWH